MNLKEKVFSVQCEPLPSPPGPFPSPKRHLLCIDTCSPLTHSTKDLYSLLLPIESIPKTGTFPSSSLYLEIQKKVWPRTHCIIHLVTSVQVPHLRLPPRLQPLAPPLPISSQLRLANGINPAPRLPLGPPESLHSPLLPPLLPPHPPLLHTGTARTEREREWHVMGLSSVDNSLSAPCIIFPLFSHPV